MAVLADAVATGEIKKYQSFVYGSFVWEIHVRYSNLIYLLVSCLQSKMFLPFITVNVCYPQSILIHVLYMGLDARKPAFWGFVNNKGADQPAHPRRLISAFVICVLESIISKLATREISLF